MTVVATQPRTLLLRDFDDQPAVRDRLRPEVITAKSADRPLLPRLITGPPGLGKSTLAEQIAVALGVPFHYILVDRGAKELPDDFRRVEPLAVIFMDEAHRMHPSVQHGMLRVLDVLKKFRNGQLTPNDPTEVVQAPITLLLATNQEHRLLNPLRSRLHHVRLERYSLIAMKRLVRRQAGELGLSITGQAVTAIAEASAGLPRRSSNTLEALRSEVSPWQLETGGFRVDKSMVIDFLNREGISEDGLTDLQQRYLGALKHGSRSLADLAALLGVSVELVENEVEPYLVETGRIRKDNAGRHLI